MNITQIIFISHQCWLQDVKLLSLASINFKIFELEVILKKILSLVTLLLSIGVTYASECHDYGDGEERGAQTKANTLQSKKMAALLAKIKSPSQLESYIKMHPTSSPLDALSSEGKNEFLTSIKFNENGISGYKYAPLERELTSTQIHAVLSLFGTQDNTKLFKNAKGYASSRFTPLDCVEDGGGTPTDQGGGSGSGNMPDYMDYHCASRATCKPEFGSICLSGC